MGQLFSATPNHVQHQALVPRFTSYFNNFEMGSIIISQKTFSLIVSLLQKGNIQEANSTIRYALKEIDNTQLDLAVTGESGAGKSSFINALRGVGHEEKDAAPVGVVEMTMERTAYKHPNFPSVRIWELPAIGATNLEPKDYLDKVKFREYDFFIIVSATRFKKIDLDLAKAIKTTKKNFYFVRTKVDSDLRNEEMSKPTTFDRENVLQQIREDCVRNLKKNNIDEPQVFLISNNNLSEYDFPIMMDTLIKDLPAQKRHIFKFSLPNIMEADIERKRDSQMQYIWLEAFNAGVSAFTPFKIFFSNNEVEKLKASLNQYRVLFGVDVASLKTLAKHLQVPEEQFKEIIKSPTLLETEKEETIGEMLLRYLKNFFIHELQYHTTDLFMEINMDIHENTTKECTIRPNSAFSFNKYFKNFKMENKIISQNTISLIESHLQKGNIQGAASVINVALREIDNAPLDLAVTGESGAGKSSFINALRGVGHEGKDAAPVGVVETTMKRTPYKHPNFPNVKIWDLPGIGSPNFQPKDYLEKVKFREYDFFIIVSATRFKKNDLDLAKAIKIMKKNFYFVRTKVDSDLQNEEISKPTTFDREKVLQQIRENCVRNIKENIIDEPQVFLISNNNLSEYDFPIMMDTLMKDLPAQKHHLFMLSLPNVTEAAIERKRDAQQQYIWLDALRGGVSAIMPLQIIISNNKMEKLQKILNNYQVLFGVDEPSLKALAKQLGVPVEQLKDSIKSPTLLETEKEETVGEMFMRYLKNVLINGGGLLGAGLYCQEIYYMQLLMLDTVADDAKVLLKETYSGKHMGIISSLFHGLSFPSSSSHLTHTPEI
uniref:IRG-type G domain-containing protein n=1 Tax=Marmota marmota marmota TaxID=9994 RepID=A0A8C6A151_MARMA